MRKGVALNEKQNRCRTRKEKEREREREKHGALLLLWRTSAGAMRPRDNAMIGLLGSTHTINQLATRVVATTNWQLLGRRATHARALPSGG